MDARLVQSLLFAGLLSGCGGQSAIKPSEILDERTGVTVGALEEPIEFLESLDRGSLGNGRRPSFAYLGPVEWDKSGELTYGLWIHIAPGTDAQVADIHLPGAVTIVLDDGRIVLSRMDAPPMGDGPYHSVVSWGQTAYFALDAPTLKRLADSNMLEMSFKGVGQAAVEFNPTHDTRATLKKFTQARGVTGD